ncbi:outer membrane lipoprotein-sorting protein [Calditrichota bacterium]
MQKKIIMSLIMIVLFQFNTLFAGSAKEIVRKANELIRASSSFSELSMKIVKPDWSRELDMKVWSLEPDYSLVLITKPVKDKGAVFLKREKEVWNWVPTISKVIKIPPSMMLQSWMGSDFNNDDLVRQSSIVEDYKHEIIAEEEYDGYECHKIQLNPKPEAGVVWGKILTWITKEGYIQLKSDYYDEDEFLVKSMIGTNIQKMGGRTFPLHWEMIPLDKPGQKTVMDYINIEFNIKTKASFYSQKNMKRVR